MAQWQTEKKQHRFQRQIWKVQKRERERKKVDKREESRSPRIGNPSPEKRLRSEPKQRKGRMVEKEWA
ncbi:hypothetical protein QQP08_004105 [Theobroma cacao]|nr:hypothetical protein QQP08_004105 [Theobroma cacao]